MLGALASTEAGDFMVHHARETPASVSVVTMQNSASLIRSRTTHNETCVWYYCHEDVFRCVTVYPTPVGFMVNFRPKALLLLGQNSYDESPGMRQAILRQ